MALAICVLGLLVPNRQKGMVSPHLGFVMVFMGIDLDSISNACNLVVLGLWEDLDFTH